MATASVYANTQYLVQVIIPGNAEPLFTRRFNTADGKTLEEIQAYAATVYQWIEANEPTLANSQTFKFTCVDSSTTETDTTFGWNGDGTWYDATPA